MPEEGRTASVDRAVYEKILNFTHTAHMDWMLPNVHPTGQGGEIPTVGIVEFRDGTRASKRIYREQVSVQVGPLSARSLPGAGAVSARGIMGSASLTSDMLVRNPEGG